MWAKASRLHWPLWYVLVPLLCYDNPITISKSISDTPCAGYVKLELPVFHIGYMKATLGILQCICKGCSHVLLDADDRRKFLK